MYYFSRIFLITITIALTACSTQMSAPQSGFLSSYAGLSADPDSSLSSVKPTVTIDPSRVKVGEVVWRGASDSGISTLDADRLVALLGKQLKENLEAMPKNPTGRPVIVRAAITRVASVSPLVNTVGTLLLIGPLDRGGAAMELEAVDADTGKQVAALKFGYYPPLSDLTARFSRLAPAEIAIAKAAVDFSKLLAPQITVGAATP
jgi:Protein of unknown function (DUF3313)